MKVVAPLFLSSSSSSSFFRQHTSFPRKIPPRRYVAPLYVRNLSLMSTTDRFLAPKPSSLPSEWLSQKTGPDPARDGAEDASSTRLLRDRPPSFQSGQQHPRRAASHANSPPFLLCSLSSGRERLVYQGRCATSVRRPFLSVNETVLDVNGCVRISEIYNWEIFLIGSISLY